MAASYKPSGNNVVRRTHFSQSCLTEAVYPPGLQMPRHAHEPASFSIVLSGGYSEIYGRSARECQSSLIVFHPAGETHSVDFGKEAVRILSIELNSGWYEQLRDCGHILNQPTTLNGFPFLLARRLYGEFRRTDEFSALIVEGLTLELLGETSRALASTHNWPIWLRRTEELLHSEFLNQTSISELADKAGVHPVHLARTFRAKNGCTIGEYKRQLRLEFACKQISSRDLSLGEIALAAGFSDQSHFARTFKNHFGVTPSEYRKLSSTR